MSEIETRACTALHDAFCRVRYLARFALNEQGRDYVFQLSDTAHNIPFALRGERFHLDNLEREVSALESMLSEPLSTIYSRCVERSQPRGGLFQRLRSILPRASGA